ncbi:GRB10-interacting GYF protein 2 isoform X2 [Hyla sarda]|uniref:GRB10-interacting GYF protein 2 isoform X2 n=1 Tax=Hyla sarda TaxID=327740 RepID=UPI0024C2DF4C|nr:GRB10-interacting GYF protein 2 isoform X2 [Hyla sarda]
MTAETQTLNFGPEWLRALSSGGSVISPPLSPALPKYKLADYRYGREEMLALYVKDNKVPLDLLDKEFFPILKEEPLLPLALVPFTEEEQRNFSMSVNSAAVLRLMGRGSSGGGGTVVGAPRGRSSSRGRGRGRGESGFYQRSFDEVESGFGRGAREMHRSQSWEERGDRRFEKPARKEPARPAFEEGGTAPAGRKHEIIRSESGNWRSLREELNGEEEEGGGVWRTAAPRRDGERWRSHSPDGGRGQVWREHPDRRKRFDFDFRERDDERGYRRTRSGSGSAEDERDSLPEWCLEDAEDETGTFDSSGAFLPSKKVQKECIPEEQELDFRPSVDGEEHSDSDGSNLEDAKETEGVQVPEQSSEISKNDSFGERPVTTPPDKEHKTPSPEKKMEPKADSPVQKATTPPVSSNNEQEAKLHTNPPAPTPHTQKEGVSRGSRGSPVSSAPSIPHSPSPAFSQSTAAQQVKDPHQGPAIHSPPIQNDLSSGPSPPSVCAAPGMGTLIPEPDEEDGLEHLEQQAQQMVAYLQDGTLDDERLTGKAPDHRVKGHSPEMQQKWYYKDPQGEIQGPFSNREMAEWYRAGYFPMTLLLRRVCDEAFQTLGDIIKLWGRVPFITPPPSRLGELGPEHIGRHQDMTALFQIQQLHYQQFLIQQQYAQVLAQQQKAALSSQQQQQLALLLQQFQTLKMRISEQPVIPTLPRAVSVPDNTSLWERQTAAAPPTMWEGSSVWDLPVDSPSQGASREQLEQLEKAKVAKIEQERREAELRAKQEEEEQCRRLEEEERKRKEELELARRKQEEALRRQREQELALRRQIEEEERKREEERRLLEERRRQEEERRRQEEEKRRLEEEKKRIEEERRRKEEEKKREEEEKRKREELQRKQEEAARWAREEEEAARRILEEARLQQEEEERKKREEAQRQKELQRQRQQQQEALRRLQQQQQQQQLAQMKLPSSSTWGQQVNSGGASQSTLSLAEIQKLEEEKEKQNLEEQRRQQQELKSMLQQQQQQQQQQKIPGWGSVAKPTVNTQSLLEIQQEEARQMQKVQQQAGRGRPANITVPPAPAPAPIPNTSNSVSSSGNSVWGNLNNNLSPQWSSDSISSIWSSQENKTSSGFWDDAVKVVAPRNAVNKNKSNASKSSVMNSKQNKKVEQEEKLVRLFQGATKCADSFTQWCEQTLHALNTAHSLDVPTFVSFLREVESAYEVHDYVRAYLGDTPEAKDFSKQFLERRNKQKTAPQNPQPQQDPGWAVYQTSQSNSQQTMLETAQSAGRKKKKQKMVRADPSLLGFSVNASSERLNMGEIETLEDY